MGPRHQVYEAIHRIPAHRAQTMDILWNILWLILALLPIVAGIAARRRIRREVGDGAGSLSDEDIRRIEVTGRMEADLEPLDMEEIERAEREFWEESWDEPDRW